jgi:hypothetical protein
VLHLRLNRPDRLNALTFNVYADLRDLLAELAAVPPSDQEGSVADVEATNVQAVGALVGTAALLRTESRGGHTRAEGSRAFVDLADREAPDRGCEHKDAQQERNVADAVEPPRADRTHTDVWTIDEPEEIDRLLDIGVDGIMTDRPAVLREVLEQRGQWFG